MIVVSIVLIFYLILFIFSFKRKIKGFGNIFKEISECIYAILKRVMPHHLLGYRKVANNLYAINPSKHQDNIIRDYYVNKIRISLIVAFAGSLLTLLVFVSNLISNGSFVNNIISKNKPGEGSKNYSYTFSSGATEEDLDFNISERVWTKNEFEKVIKSNIKKWHKSILGENSNFKHISHKLNLNDKFLDLPIRISWTTDNKYVNSSGDILYENIKDGSQEVVIKAFMTYSEYEHFEKIKAIVTDEGLKENEKLHYAITNNIRSQNENKHLSKVALPTKVKGHKIMWFPRQENSYIILFILVILLIVLTYFGIDSRLKSKKEDRDNELIADYPDFLNKISLLINAGMSTSQAIKKIAIDNSKSNRFIYKELNYALEQTKFGLSERVALENFSKRLGIVQYTRLINAINQNIVKGGYSLTSFLKANVKSALNEKKLIAKSKSEKAGAKLLIPMVVLLFTIMLIVIIPAFLSI